MSAEMCKLVWIIWFGILKICFYAEVLTVRFFSQAGYTNGTSPRFYICFSNLQLTIFFIGTDGIPSSMIQIVKSFSTFSRSILLERATNSFDMSQVLTSRTKTTFNCGFFGIFPFIFQGFFL
jgi:hypothetical protein